MKEQFNNIYQFKITLLGIKPPIWRRIQVPEKYTFWNLHTAIQNVMTWKNYHLHEFEIPKPGTETPDRIGIPSEEFGEFEETPTLPEKKVKIADYFSLENKVALYTYDFEDNWQLKVQLEKILPKKEGLEYPVCVAGKRASVPEDSGGIWGYEEMLEILKNSQHEEYEDTRKWLGKSFDPEHFDPKEVRFSRPKKGSKEEKPNGRARYWTLDKF